MCNALFRECRCGFRQQAQYDQTRCEKARAAGTPQCDQKKGAEYVVQRSCHSQQCCSQAWCHMDERIAQLMSQRPVVKLDDSWCSSDLLDAWRRDSSITTQVQKEVNKFAETHGQCNRWLSPGQGDIIEGYRRRP